MGPEGVLGGGMSAAQIEDSNALALAIVPAGTARGLGLKDWGLECGVRG